MATWPVRIRSRRPRFKIWAPEEDTSDYYRGPAARCRRRPDADRPTAGHRGDRAAPRPLPPSGVDAGAFLRPGRDARRAGVVDNLLAIDKAANNTSVVFGLEWRGWRLLFPGDAELASWKTMKAKGVLEPVHFLKVATTAATTARPDGDVLDAFLPRRRRTRRRVAR